MELYNISTPIFHTLLIIGCWNVESNAYLNLNFWNLCENSVNILWDIKDCAYTGIRKTIRFKSAVGLRPNKFRMGEVGQLFALHLRRWVNSFSGHDFKIY